MTRLFESGLVEQTEAPYYIYPRRVGELTHRLESLDSLGTLFEWTPTDDA